MTNSKHDNLLPEQINSLIAESLEPVAPTKEQAVDMKNALKKRIKSPSIEEFLTIRAHQGDWITIAPGVEKKLLNIYADEHIHCFLLRMQPESTLPEHEHFSNEECLMLEGDVSFGEIQLSAGDFHLARKGSKHPQVYSKTGALAYIRAYEA